VRPAPASLEGIDEIGSARNKLDSFGGRPTLEIPPRLLCDLFNSANDDRIRGTILRYIRRYKWILAERGHAAEGFAMVDGRLTFDQDLYDEAFYRGKMSTYLAGAADVVEKLRGAARFVRIFNEDHSRAAKASGAKMAGRVATEVPAYAEFAPEFIERMFGLPALGGSLRELSAPATPIGKLKPPRKGKKR
jgi:hypothetical protein